MAPELRTTSAQEFFFSLSRDEKREALEVVIEGSILDKLVAHRKGMPLLLPDAHPRYCYFEGGVLHWDSDNKLNEEPIKGVAVKDFIPPAKSRMQPKPKCLLVFDSARKPGYQIKFITANPRQAKQWAVGSTLAADGVSPTDLMVETDGGGLGGNILAKRTSTSVLIESEGDAAQKSKLLEAMKADKADEDEDEDDEEEDAEEEEDEVGSPLPGTASSAPIASAGGANAQIVQVAKPMSGAQLALLVFGVLVLMVLADKLDICENSYRLVAPLVEDPRGFLLAIPARLRSVAVALPSTVRWLVMRLVSLVRRGVLGAPAAIKGFVTQLLTGLVWLVRNSGRLLKGSVGKAYSTVVAARSRAVQALDKVLEKSITSLVKMKK
jgi:hypothetical protein